MHAIILSLFPLMALIVLGYIFKRRNTFTAEFWAGAEKLNYYVLFPAMLFANLATASIEMHIVKTIVFVSAVVLGCACIAMFSLKKILGIKAARFGVYVQSLVRFNTYMGLAIIASLFHQQGMLILAIALAINIPVVNVISVLALTDKSDTNIQNIILSLLKNPLILSCVFGALFNFSGLPLWTGLESFIKQLAVCSLPLGLLCVGAALQFFELKKDVFTLVLNSLARLILMPVLTYFACKLLHVSTLEMQVLVIFAGLPTASASYILTKVFGGDSQLMAGVISLQTLCSAFTLPIVIWAVM